MKQQLNEEFRRMQKLAGTKLGENIEEAKEDLFSKYKTKIETLRDEFVSDLKSNLKDIKKLSKEDKTKLSQMVRNLTAAVDDMLSERKLKEIEETPSAPEIERNVEDGLKNALSILKTSTNTIKPSSKDKTLKEIEPVSFTVGLMASAPGLLELLGNAVDGISKPFLKAGQSGTVVGKALAKAGHKLEDGYLRGIAAVLKTAFPQTFPMEYQENNELGKAAKKVYMVILVAAGVNAGMSAANAHSIISKAIEGGASLIKAAEAAELAAAIT
jgi:hypothetical protein